MTEQTFGNYLKELTKEAKDNENLKKLLSKDIVSENTLNEIRTNMIEIAKQGFSGGSILIKTIVSETFINDLDKINSKTRKNLLEDIKTLFELRFPGVQFIYERKDKIDYLCFWWV